MAVIRSFGKYLPAEIRTNAWLAESLGVTAEWIGQVSGIRERRVAGPADSVVSMGVEAARQCLEKAGVKTAAVKMLLVASGSSERIFPGPASQLAAALGLGDTPAIDLPLASAGALFGMALAAGLADATGPVLVVASELMSRAAMLEPVEKNIAILFGDGAGACLVMPDGPGLQVLHSALHSDGAQSNELSRGLDRRIFMNGMSVIRHAGKNMPGAIREVLAAADVTPAEVGQFITHQANQNLIDRVARAIEVEPERFYSNIGSYGNTSSASLLIAAQECFEGKNLPEGTKVCFAAFGAGYHWGALLTEQR